MEFNWNLQGLPGPFLNIRTTSQCAVVIAGYRHQGRCRRHPASLSGTGLATPLPVLDWFQHQHIYRCVPLRNLTQTSDSPDSAFNGRHGMIRSCRGSWNWVDNGYWTLWGAQRWLAGCFRASEMLWAENSLFQVERSLGIAGDELRMPFCAQKGAQRWLTATENTCRTK